MKKMIILAFALITGTVLFAQNDKKPAKPATAAVAEKAKYSCPMHPEVTSDKPGKCSKCGMDLVKAKKEKVYACPMHPEVTSNEPGKCSKCGMDLVKVKKEKTKTYTCSMHPDVTSDKPGKCPKCGMDLVKVKKEKS